MLNVVDHEHFDKVCEEAEKRGIRHKLQEKLDYLSTYACPEEDDTQTRCNLGYDFAPLSFSFLMFRKDENGAYKPWFNGGLAFHPGSTEPDRSFSVELCGSSEPHWSVHT